MTAIFLLGKSFVRQNRWLLIVLLLWPLVVGASVGYTHSASTVSDVLEIVQPEMLYGLLIVTFLASSAVYNERRSRRILGVLSKAVSRIQYLLGFLVGATWFAVVYLLMIGVSVLWLLGWSTAIRSALSLCFDGIVASIWAVSVGLCFSTFAYPFIAATLAGAVTLGPMILAGTHPILAPVAALIRGSNSFSGKVSAALIAAALAESILFLLLAERIFSRRDVTGSLE